MSRKRSLLSDPSDEATKASQTSQTQYFKSGPIEDRDSTFIGAFSTTISATELQKLPEFETASHRMAAWRKPSSQRTLNVGPVSGSQPIYVTGSDDDGERYGGKRIEKVLNELHAEGAAVVARWFGGALLGPARFTHIENATKQAVQSLNASAETAAKRRKVESDLEEKKRLVRALEERDQSIATLRQLLAAKTSSEPKVDALVEGEPTTKPSPVKASEYASMPLLRLKQLDKARDATISWILKQIDTAEEKQS